MASKKNRSRKSLAVALAIVGVAGLSMASAAQLTVSSDEIAAGVDTFAACDGSVTVSYTTAYHAAGGAYATSDFYVSEVVVTDLDTTACDAKDITVQVIGVSGALIAPAYSTTIDSA